MRTTADWDVTERGFLCVGITESMGGHTRGANETGTPREVVPPLMTGRNV